MLSLFSKVRGANSADEFLRRVLEVRPPFLDPYLWQENPWDSEQTRGIWLHLGCGDHVLEGFHNIDFIADQPGIITWDLLDPWPEVLVGNVAGVYSEELLEHFFYAEQLYIGANVNRMLLNGAVNRVIMPNLKRLLAVYSHYEPGPQRFFYKKYGALTGADALNAGLRFSGHRWLHDADSFRIQGGACGFEVKPSSCEHSLERQFNGINKRDEKNSLSFAHDLVKRSEVRRQRNSPENVTKSSRLVELQENQILYRSLGESSVSYRLEPGIRLDQIVVLVIRAANLSNAREHSVHRLIINRDPEKTHVFDETLKSKPCMNAMGFTEIMRFGNPNEYLESIEFWPATAKDEYFILGDLEIYHLDYALSELS